MSAELVLNAAWPMAVAAALPYGLYKGWRRLQLSRAKHPSLAGHSLWAKRIGRLIPGYSYDETRFFAADGAPPDIVALRRAGFERLSKELRERSPQTLELTTRTREGLSDLQFIARYRVPFQFSDYARAHLPMGAFWSEAQGVHLTDLDGNTYMDLTGSYGVNVFGVDFYKACMSEGARLGSALGPVLGGYHSSVARNVERLRAISGLDEVSFHMSGTEAVMQAVRLARYHTRKRHLVRFTGSYHGWWEDVQPGPGNPLPPRETYTLKDMDADTLRVLRTRNNIACVLVNPLQALHPNRNAPGDSTLIDGVRQASFDKAAYTAWLQELRRVCTERGIVLIFDEVFVGFRLAPGGAQQYFGVKADMVTYGKTLGGGLPVGVVCGQKALMQRFRPERPADICFARGTFNAHPYVMGAMDAFLSRLETPDVKAIYNGLDERWQARASAFNQALEQADLPLRVAALSSIWTVNYHKPSRYHWLLQFYLREAGLALSWVGTGRFVFSLNYTDADMAEVTRRVLAACERIRADGWWWQAPGVTAKTHKRQVLKELLLQRLTGQAV
ncbi:aminotransferase class III-fold pyridoxal phosphate-dependent enzyme [Hydrogenophaga sp.]|uniref:aminotransferase class III-fold pyridoxal phosphate-dependent enzyme n=1 Tax=Hydrogenophaga sp. TaxID=1904254 RepID=UPI00262986CB|nr:aminotransferase class III-fold pyridoxal phosphate-dependent enzyme [Hydrogenophaga sp.]MDM7948628.1 aminotransferase class III-fold pyridoxal phosphate-dependent enzyme [Hydrogenophaga sp.]